MKKPETRVAVIYLRSSKDLHDVSIDAQRHELKKLAKDRNIIIVGEYSDVEVSAKDDDRPGFQSMLLAMGEPTRDWNTIFALDTSRIWRRLHGAQYFEHDAAKRGVKIAYAKLPETDPISDFMLKAIFQVLDQVHSMLSREKGLAGMAQNIRSGARAGGPAPTGYDLDPYTTGAIRNGEPVMKSRLVPNADAVWVERYLKARACSVPRAKVAGELGLKCSPSTLIGIEWNALVYAGHLVWGVRHEKQGGKFLEGKKRRPRAEWQINHNQHQALISDREAEVILSRLENSKIGQSVAAAKASTSNYMLTGFLVTPDGQNWTGNGKRSYRTKSKEGGGRWLLAAPVDEAVLAQIDRDAVSPEFIRLLKQQAIRAAESQRIDPAAGIRKKIAGLDAQISKCMDLALKLDDSAPALMKADELQAERRTLKAELTRLESEYVQQSNFVGITEEMIAKALTQFASYIRTCEPGEVKAALQVFVSKVVLDPEKYRCEIHYNIPVGPVTEGTEKTIHRTSVALLPGFEPGFRP